MPYKALLDDVNLRINSTIGKIKINELTPELALVELEKINKLSIESVIELDNRKTEYIILNLDLKTSNLDIIKEFKKLESSEHETYIDSHITKLSYVIKDVEALSYIANFYKSVLYTSYKNIIEKVSFIIREAK